MNKVLCYVVKEWTSLSMSELLTMAAEKTWRESLLNGLSCPLDDRISEGTELNCVHRSLIYPCLFVCCMRHGLSLEGALSNMMMMMMLMMMIPAVSTCVGAGACGESTDMVTWYRSARVYGSDDFGQAAH